MMNHGPMFYSFPNLKPVPGEATEYDDFEFIEYDTASHEVLLKDPETRKIIRIPAED